MPARPRVAFFPDTFDQADGVSVFARHFKQYAQQQRIPLLLIHAGSRDRTFVEGSVIRMQLGRGPLTFPLDRHHWFDLGFMRHYSAAARALRRFRPDVIQITGPGDAGILGLLLARKLNVPLAGFWQTNLPQYARLRAARACSRLPGNLRRLLAWVAGRFSEQAVDRFYTVPDVNFAPNPEIAAQLALATRKPCEMLPHGVDSAAFHPGLRERPDGPFTIGYVGRLSPEKNVRELAQLERRLSANGNRNFRFLIVGQGGEERWLKANLQHADFPGVLCGEKLARAFANMDVLAFPSGTDTFGLVVLEALASGVPAVVTAEGGPRYIVEHGETGYIASSFEQFADSIARLMADPDLLASMRIEARRYAVEHSWPRAFDEIYRSYGRMRDAASTPGSLAPLLCPWRPSPDEC